MNLLNEWKKFICKASGSVAVSESEPAFPEKRQCGSVMVLITYIHFFH
jgi:hypothetical protein